MTTLWAIVVVVFGGLAWGGQVMAWLVPDIAVRLGLMESEDSVEAGFFADARAEAMWDSLTLWTMVAAGALLVVDNAWWTYFGLVGGGMFIYFAGRGIASRRAIQRVGFSVGRPKTVAQAYVFLSLWGSIGLITVLAAINSLQTGG
jgi:hypothetical protein